MWLTACGGDTSGTPSGDLPAQTCSTPAACGGDLIGTWQIQDDCAPTQGVPACSGSNAVFNADTRNVSGTVQFDTNGTEHFTENALIGITASAASSCLSSACEDSGSDLAAGFIGSGYEITNADCSSHGALCDCTFDATVTETEQVSYSTSGSELTQTDSTGTRTTSTFCVSGTTLTIVSPQGEVTTATKG